METARLLLVSWQAGSAAPIPPARLETARRVRLLPSVRLSRGRDGEGGNGKKAPGLGVGVGRSAGVCGEVCKGIHHCRGEVSRGACGLLRCVRVEECLPQSIAESADRGDLVATTAEPILVLPSERPRRTTVCLRRCTWGGLAATSFAHDLFPTYAV